MTNISIDNRNALQVGLGLFVAIAAVLSGSAFVATTADGLPKSKRLDRGYANHGFARLPSPRGARVETFGCFEDSRKNLYARIATKSRGRHTRHQLVSLTPRGKTRRNFGKRGSAVLLSGTEDIQFDKKMRAYAISNTKKAGRRTFRVTRLTRRGKKDRTFGSKGTAKIDVDYSTTGREPTVTVLPSGRVIGVSIVEIEDQYQPSRLTMLAANGRPMSLPKNRGIGAHNLFIDSVGETTNGRILVVASPTYGPSPVKEFRVVKGYTARGEVDRQWGNNGVVTIGSASPKFVTLLNKGRTFKVDNPEFSIGGILGPGSGGSLFLKVGLSSGGESEDDDGVGYAIALKLDKNGKVDNRFGIDGASLADEELSSSDSFLDDDYEGEIRDVTLSPTGQVTSTVLSYTGLLTESVYFEALQKNGRGNAESVYAKLRRFDISDNIQSRKRKRMYVCGVYKKRGYAVRLKTK